MEAKASRMSQRSNPEQKVAPPKVVGKTLSKASLSPSQMSERTRMNAALNKDPLDALSRVGTRPLSERRSGLQDVDDDYLKTVVYAFAKQTSQNAAARAKVTADMIPAGVPTLRTPYRGDRAPAGNETPAPVSTSSNQAQAQNQPTAQLQAQQPQQTQPPTQMQTQQQTQQSQPLAQMQAVPPSQPASTPDSVPAEKPQPTQPELVPPQGGQAQQRQAGGGEAELYTTCPNCRATLYLVRNPGEASPYAMPQEGGATQAQQ